MLSAYILVNKKQKQSLTIGATTSADPKGTLPPIVPPTALTIATPADPKRAPPQLSMVSYTHAPPLLDDSRCKIKKKKITLYRLSSWHAHPNTNRGLTTRNITGERDSNQKYNMSPNSGTKKVGVLSSDDGPFFFAPTHLQLHFEYRLFITHTPSLNLLSTPLSSIPAFFFLIGRVCLIANRPMAPYRKQHTRC